MTKTDYNNKNIDMFLNNIIDYTKACQYLQTILKKDFRINPSNPIIIISDYNHLITWDYSQILICFWIIVCHYTKAYQHL